MVTSGDATSSAGESDLPSRILTWLGSQGYPLEMEVARQFRAARALAIQSDYYTDPEDNITSREIDVWASWSRREGAHFARVSFVVECKRSGDKPWVAFTSTDQTMHAVASIVQRAANPAGRGFLHLISGFKESHQLPLLKAADRLAYGLTQAFTSGSDSSYQATLSAAKAAQALSVRFDTDPNVLHIVIPVVVIDGHLFECFLDASSAIQIQEAESVVLAWRRDIVDVNTIIHVITKPAIAQFVADAESLAAELLDAAFAHSFWDIS